MVIAGHKVRLHTLVQQRLVGITARTVAYCRYMSQDSEGGGLEEHDAVFKFLHKLFYCRKKI